MTNTQSEGWGRPLFLSICGALLLALATLFVVQGALRSIVGRMDADGAAWFVVVLLTTMCLSASAGAFLIGVFAVMLFERSQFRAHRAADVTLDASAAQPPAFTPLLSNGINQRQMLPRAKLIEMSAEVVRDMRPHTPPTQSNISAKLQCGGGTASAIQDMLKAWGMVDVSNGVPAAWT